MFGGVSTSVGLFRYQRRLGFQSLLRCVFWRSVQVPASSGLSKSFQMSVSSLLMEICSDASVLWAFRVLLGASVVEPFMVFSDFSVFSTCGGLFRCQRHLGFQGLLRCQRHLDLWRSLKMPVSLGLSCLLRCQVSTLKVSSDTIVVWIKTYFLNCDCYLYSVGVDLVLFIVRSANY